MWTVLVNTCKRYRTTTLPVLTSDLLLAGVAPDSVVIVSGGEDDDTESRVDGYRVVHVTYNAFDVTALIWASEHMSPGAPGDAVFLMHDTVRVRAPFAARLQELALGLAARPRSWKALRLQGDRPSMNMGLYSREHLAALAERLAERKRWPATPTELQEEKGNAIRTEDEFLESDGGAMETVVTREIITSFVEGRTLVSTFPRLGLTKTQRNFEVGGSNGWVVDI